jgi:hypothetical protein
VHGVRLSSLWRWPVASLFGLTLVAAFAVKVLVAGWGVSWGGFPEASEVGWP